VARDGAREREADLESRTLAEPLAAGDHVAAVHLRQVLDNREAEAQAAVGARESLLRLAEPIEHKRQEV